MARWRKVAIRAGLLVVALSGGALAVVTKSRAHELITNPAETRKRSDKTPADYQLPFENVTVKTEDGLKLAGWFVPSTNGATIIVQHGYKDARSLLLGVSKLFHDHGYSVLIQTVRAHDDSDGELMSFGHQEMKDMRAWYEYLLSRPDVDRSRIGLFGVSMGGSLAIQFSALTPGIRATVADCAFSSLDDTVETSLKFFTGLPPFPFAPMIVFWSEREGGFESKEIDAKQWIGRISPRPILVMQGGSDQVVSPESGRRLFEAAGEPKELWFEPSLGHVQFYAKMPQEFEKRVVGFFDKYLEGRR